MGAEAEGVSCMSVTPITGMSYCWVKPCPNPRGGGPCHLLTHLALLINLQGRSVNSVFQRITVDKKSYVTCVRTQPVSSRAGT